MEATDIQLTIPLFLQVLLIFPMAALVALGIWYLWLPVSWVFLGPLQRWLPSELDLRKLRPAVVKGGVFGAVAGWLALVLLLWGRQTLG